jgi:curved DNA-binding protein CbpA
MSFKLTLGLVAFDCQDHYAVLGIPIDCEFKVIRKQYLGINRAIHPDTCGPDVDKTQAITLLSKVVNPAYAVLSNDKQRQEYRVVLRLIGQRYAQDKERVRIQTAAAQTLLKSRSYQETYAALIQELAKQQFKDLNQFEGIVSQISELNLVYLLRQTEEQQVAPETIGLGQPVISSSARPDTATTRPAPTAASPADPPSAATPQSPSDDRSVEPPTTVASSARQMNSEVNQKFVTDCIRRAREYLKKGSYAEARRELETTLGKDRFNSECYSLLGQTYLVQKIYSTAGQYFRRARELDPENMEAIKGLETVEKVAQQKAKAAPAAGVKAPDSGKKRSGLFGLFGDKKK